MKKILTYQQWCSSFEGRFALNDVIKGPDINCSSNRFDITQKMRLVYEEYKEQYWNN